MGGVFICTLLGVDGAVCVVRSQAQKPCEHSVGLEFCSR